MMDMKTRRPERVVAPDDVLTAEESALVKNAEYEMRQGKYVTLGQLRHDLGRKNAAQRIVYVSLPWPRN